MAGNRFLFIVPLTPETRLTEGRRRLQEICISALSGQKYDLWQAILIGSKMPAAAANESRFIHLEYEALKEEKLQYASDYIHNSGINFDYVIRLDDDDIICPMVLERLKDRDFNIFVDLYHSFWTPVSNRVAQTVRFWFPNTFVIKREIAFSVYGAFPGGNHRNLRGAPYVIENEHNVIHQFFEDRKLEVDFASRKYPVYLRSISGESITANSAGDQESYYRGFGSWNTNVLADFGFLKPLGGDYQIPAQRLNERVRNLINDRKAMRGFKRKLNVGRNV
jgi:hypothetical protein